MASITQTHPLPGRIELHIDGRLGRRHERELSAFIHYCVHRIERELGASRRWSIKVVPSPHGFACTVTVLDREARFEASRTGCDDILATWDAICSLEQALREAHLR